MDFKEDAVMTSKSQLRQLLEQGGGGNPEETFECFLSAIESHVDSHSIKCCCDEIIQGRSEPDKGKQETEIELHAMGRHLSLIQRPATTTTPPAKRTTNPDGTVWNADLAEALAQLGLRVLPALTPLEIHATLLQMSVPWSSPQANTSRSSTTTAVLSLLLCCHAMNRCPIPLRNRRERWRSVLWESLRMFQRVADDGQDPEVYVQLWQSYFLPALSNVCKALKQPLPSSARNITPKEQRFPAAFIAAIVGTTSRLLVQSATSHRGTIHLEQIGEELIDALTENIDVELISVVLCGGPWRRLASQHSLFQACSSSQPTLESLLALYSQKEYHTDDHDDYIDEDDQVSERNTSRRNNGQVTWSLLREETCYVNTEWDITGVAMLVGAAALSTNYWRPWSPTYRWRLFFTHVPDLLHAVLTPTTSETNDGDDVEMEHEEVQSNSKSDLQKDVQGIQLVGYNLLRDCIRRVNAQSVELPCPGHFGKPLSPIGAFQLLSNHVMARSMSSSAARTSPTPMPSAGEIYLLMKQLLSRFTPCAQYELVPKLVQQCPHAGMQPKLLEMWRGFIPWKDDDTSNRVLAHLVDTFIVELASQHIEQIGNGVVVVRQVDDLIPKVEMYLAALGLIQLWFKLQKPPADQQLRQLPALEHDLTKMNAALEGSFQTWDAQERSGSTSYLPEQWFRLKLLQNSVHVTLALLR